MEEVHDALSPGMVPIIQAPPGSKVHVATDEGFRVYRVGPQGRLRLDETSRNPEEVSALLREIPGGSTLYCLRRTPETGWHAIACVVPHKEARGTP